MHLPENHGFPQEAEMLEKYSGAVTVKEILDMYDNDPESFFMDKGRTVSVSKFLIIFKINIFSGSTHNQGSML
jgi:hypothetical protein